MNRRADLLTLRTNRCFKSRRDEHVQSMRAHQLIMRDPCVGQAEQCCQLSLVPRPLNFAGFGRQLHCRPPQFNCGGNYATSDCWSTSRPSPHLAPEERCDECNWFLPDHPAQVGRAKQAYPRRPLRRFNPRLSCERRRFGIGGQLRGADVSIHASRVRGDWMHCSRYSCRACFNPRLSCERRPLSLCAGALRNSFNPRLSCERRRGTFRYVPRHSRFQSTPLV